MWWFLLLLPLISSSFQRFRPILLKPEGFGELGYSIEAGLSEAIIDLHQKISVSVEEKNFVDYNQLKECSGQFTEKLEAVDVFSNDGGAVDGARGLSLEGFNHALLLERNHVDCYKKDGSTLLATARPCCVKSGLRPLLGVVNICFGTQWEDFRAAKDLFRHEIMHALGFGTIVPQNTTQMAPTPDKYHWKHGSDVQIASRTYMDFALTALVVVRTHFDCPIMKGLETDGTSKIHLNEYIFGNELMTPKLSNRENLFTEISAAILEETFLGDRPWYRVDRAEIELESASYWFGRKWGCQFVLKSCHDYMENRGIGFPFCAERNYLQGGYVKYCVRAGGEIKQFVSKCSRIPYRKEDLSDNGITARPLPFSPTTMGSNGLYRFCPINQDLINDNIQLPAGAVVYNCD